MKSYREIVSETQPHFISKTESTIVSFFTYTQSLSQMARRCVTEYGSCDRVSKASRKSKILSPQYHGGTLFERSGVFQPKRFFSGRRREKEAPFTDYFVGPFSIALAHTNHKHYTYLLGQQILKLKIYLLSSYFILTTNFRVKVRTFPFSICL